MIRTKVWLGPLIGHQGQKLISGWLIIITLVGTLSEVTDNAPTPGLGPSWPPQAREDTIHTSRIIKHRGIDIQSPGVCISSTGGAGSEYNC